MHMTMVPKKCLEEILVLLFVLLLLTGNAVGSNRDKKSKGKSRSDVADGSEFSTRVVGGSDSAPGRYPYYVLFPDRPCGGSLIAPDVVLTAAHCRGELVIAQVGRYDLSVSDDDFQLFDVIEEVPHPLWDDNIPLYDVMLVKLSGQSTQPLLTINNNSTVPQTEGQILTLMGFDFDILGEIAGSTILQEVQVGYIPNDVCAQLEDPSIGISLDGLVTDQWLCADEDDRGICFGDAGNPLILAGTNNTSDVQVGLAAANFGCENNLLPDVHTRIQPNQQWIASAVCELSDNPPDSFNCFSSSPTFLPTMAPETPQPTNPLPTTNPTRFPSHFPSQLPTTASPETKTMPPSLAPTQSTSTSTSTPSSTPTRTATNTPSAPPTSLPSSKPVATPTRDTNAPISRPPVDAEQVQIEVFIHFDDFPPETRWSITRVSTRENVASVDFGTYDIFLDSVTELVSLLAGEEYVFLIEDLFGDGMCCAMPGTYIVRQDGTQLVMGGGRFGFSEETAFTTLVSAPVTPPPSPAPITPAPTSITPAPTDPPTTTISPSDTNSSHNPSGTPSTPAPSNEPSLLNIFDTINGSGQFPTFVEALLVTGLASELEGPGPFTVFVPTEEAFDSLPPGVLEFLFRPENVDSLAEVLLYHLVTGAIRSSDIMDGSQAETIGGGTVTFSVRDGRVQIEGATIMIADTLSSNGVIHIIDEVLLPDDLVLPGPTPTVSPIGAPTVEPITTPTNLPEQIPTRTEEPTETLPSASSSPSMIPPSLDYPLETLSPTRAPKESESLDYPLETLPPTSAPLIAQTSISQAFDDGIIEDVDLDLVFHGGLHQIGWSVRNTRTENVVASRPYGPLPSNHMDLHDTIALLRGQRYEFVLEDGGVDCCSVPLSYKLSRGPSIIVEGGVGNGEEVRATFSLVTTPSEKTLQPSTALQDAGRMSSSGIIEDVILDFSYHDSSMEIGWSIRNIATSHIVASRPIGPLPINHVELRTLISLLKGQPYEFLIEVGYGGGSGASLWYKLSKGGIVVAGGEVHAGDKLRTPFDIRNSPPNTDLQTDPQIENPGVPDSGIISDVHLDLILHGGPVHIGWSVKNTATGIIVASRAVGPIPLDRFELHETIALLTGKQYEFVLDDGDGGCSNTPVSYKLSKGRRIVAGGEVFAGDELRATFNLGDSPPKKGIRTVGLVGDGIIADVQLDLISHGDPRQLGWSVRNTGTKNIVASRPVGPLPMNRFELHQTIALLSGQQYELSIEEADGDCCSAPVSYKLSRGMFTIAEGVVNEGDEAKTTFEIFDS